jgi:hypothetical protein
MRRQQRFSKYRNKRTDGYASKKEANRAAELKLLEKAGVISGLREQVKFTLIPKIGRQRECAYFADFAFTDSDGLPHVMDAKGYRTEVYKIKKKLMKFVHNIEVEEV